MKKILLILFILPFINFAQTQLGVDIDGEAAFDESGTSISLSSDGTILAVGAPNNNDNGNNSGHVRIFKYNNSNWEQLGIDINGEAENDKSGYSVDLSSDGTIVAIGARGNDGNGSNSGHVRVYKYNETIWEQLGADIDGEANSDESGTAVSLSSDGTILAIGAPGNDESGNNAGHVRVYKYDGMTWNKLGNDINGERNGDGSGNSVSLSSNGSIVAIGAIYNNGSGQSSGHVRIFNYTNGNWEQLGGDINGESTLDLSGWSISLSSDGTIIAIGATLNDGKGFNAGHVRVYEYSSEVWRKIGNDIDGDELGDQKGVAVSLSSNGEILAVGSNTNSDSRSDHIHLYKNNNGNWENITLNINPEQSDDLSGHAISLSSDANILALGGKNNDGNGNNAGHVRVYNLSSVLSIPNLLVSKFLLYPNPTKNNVSIQLEKGIQLKNVNIYNQLGQFILSSREQIINTFNLSKGIYFLEIETNKGRATDKLIIE